MVIKTLHSMKNHTITDNQAIKFSAQPNNFCSVHATMNVFAGKWKILILWNLHKEIKRFGQLKNSIPGITQAVLSKQLQDLINHKIVHREIYAEIPPKVEYSLTTTGQSLIPVISIMEKWGVDYIKSSEGNETLECLWSI
ncbi:MAG: helix-turn-helix domain-containing protein [Ginsengibacter sp.]